MNGLVVWCALFAADGGLVGPVCAWNMFGPESYRVDLQLVEVQSEDKRAVEKAPQIKMLAGAQATVAAAPRTWIYPVSFRQHDLDNTRNCSWNVRLQDVKNGTATVEIRVRKQLFTSGFRTAGLTVGKSYILKTRVKLGTTDRVVISRDSDGVPTSWVAVQVQYEQPKLRSPLPVNLQPTTSSFGELCPIWFDPF